VPLPRPGGECVPAIALCVHVVLTWVDRFPHTVSRGGLLLATGGCVLVGYLSSIVKDGTARMIRFGWALLGVAVAALLPRENIAENATVLAGLAVEIVVVVLLLNAATWFARLRDVMGHVEATR
jgi:hypothetical protein